MISRFPTILAVAVFLTAVACGKLGERYFGDREDETADFGAALANGPWVQPCHGVDAFQTRMHLTIALTVTDGTYTRRDSFFKDEDCTTVALTKDLKGALAIGDSYDRHTRDATVTTDSLVMTVHDPDYVLILSALKHCGVTWTAGAATDVTEAACRVFSNQGKELNALQMPLNGGKRKLQLVTTGDGAVNTYAGDIYVRAEDVPAKGPKAACAYEDVPGKAEIFLVSEKSPRDEQTVLISLHFRPNDPTAVTALGLPMKDDTLPLAALGYPRSCAEGNGLTPGAALPMVLQKAVAGDDCPFLRFRLPAATPEVCQDI